jgi:hypothetical protein
MALKNIVVSSDKSEVPSNLRLVLRLGWMNSSMDALQSYGKDELVYDVLQTQTAWRLMLHTGMVDAHDH